MPKEVLVMQSHGRGRVTVMEPTHHTLGKTLRIIPSAGTHLAKGKRVNLHLLNPHEKVPELTKDGKKGILVKDGNTRVHVSPKSISTMLSTGMFLIPKETGEIQSALSKLTGRRLPKIAARLAKL